jgi:signal transduction histidine kinase
MSDSLIIGIVCTTVAVVLLGALINTKRQASIVKAQSGEIKKHLLELEDRNKELQKLNQEKLQIISLVSHDLKGPFNRIFALIQLMNLEKGKLTDDQKEYLNKIHQISVDGLMMVRNLLDSRRIEDKGIDLNPVLLDFSALIATLARNYKAIAEKKKIEIVLDIPEPINVKIDKLYISRVIENLFSNAIKFSSEEKKIFVKLVKSPNWIELSVKDQGPGISMEDQVKLYQRFQRLTARPTAGESSTGLGLFIVKTILDKIEAEILCESEVGEGTCFTVRLPDKFFS